jgi:hypothetical protein
MSYKNNKAPLEEIVKLMPQNMQDNLFMFLEKTKTSPRWYATNSFNYKFKNKSVYRFRINGVGLYSHIGNGWQINLTLSFPDDLDETLNGLTEKERKFYFKNIRKCRRCNPDHGKGKRFVILGNEYWGCAEPEIEIVNPTVSDINILCKLFDIRKQNIAKYL